MLLNVVCSLCWTVCLDQSWQLAMWFLDIARRCHGFISTVRLVCRAYPNHHASWRRDGFTHIWTLDMLTLWKEKKHYATCNILPPNILLPKTFCHPNILPTRHFATKKFSNPDIVPPHENKHFAAKTFCHQDVFPLFTNSIVCLNQLIVTQTCCHPDI